MDIQKIKDNDEIRSESYIDSELFRDNFNGTDEELKIIAETVYELVDASNTNDDTFMDECKSMISCDYDYLNMDQINIVCKMIDEIICGEL